MDNESRRNDKLQRILQDRSSEPRYIPLEYLRKITNNFSDVQLIGTGGFGKVYKGVRQNGECIAVKKLDPVKATVQKPQFKNEVYHLMRLKHPNIVLFVGYCYETVNECVSYNGKYVFAEMPQKLVCLEYLPNGSLDRHLSDFGLSKLFDTGKTQTHTTSPAGSLGYMAPEYIYQHTVSTKADIYSLGAIIIEVIKGRMFGPSGIETLFCKDFEPAFSPEEWELATLVLTGPNYQIKFKKTGEVIIDEKYSQSLQLKIPIGRTTQFVLVTAGAAIPFNTKGISEPSNEDYDVRLRDLIVSVMRTFQKKALDAKRKGKA